MKFFIFLFVGMVLTSCSNNPAKNTDRIAGNWYANVDWFSEDGEEITTKEIGILIIPNCTTGMVCGKFSQEGQCPSDIILTKVDGNLFFFIAETVSGTRHSCSAGGAGLIELNLQLDGTLHFMFHSGIERRGILIKK